MKKALFVIIMIAALSAAGSVWAASASTAPAKITRAGDTPMATSPAAAVVRPTKPTTGIPSSSRIITAKPIITPERITHSTRPVTATGCSTDGIFIEGDLAGTAGNWRMKIAGETAVKPARPEKPDTMTKTSTPRPLIKECKFSKNYRFSIEENGDGTINVIGDKSAWSKEFRTGDNRAINIPLGKNNLVIDCADIYFERAGKATGTAVWSLPIMDSAPAVCDNVKSNLIFHKEGEVVVGDDAAKKEIDGTYEISIKADLDSADSGTGEPLPLRPTGATATSVSTKGGFPSETCNMAVSALLNIQYDPAKSYIKITDPENGAVLFEGNIVEKTIDTLTLSGKDGKELIIDGPSIDIVTDDDGNLIIAGEADANWSLSNGTVCDQLVKFTGVKASLTTTTGTPDPNQVTVPADSKGGGCSLIVKR